jgi:GAF domain-containing protein
MPRVSNDVALDPFHFKNPALPDTRAELTLPMSVGGRLIGVLDVQSTEKDAFAEEDVRALEAIAGELAIAVDNARLVRETADELQRTEGLYHGRARESWARFARAGVPTMLRVGADGGEFSQASMAITQQAFDNVATALSDDRHEVAVPVIVGGEAIATISARRPVENEAWNKDDVELIQAAAVQVGLALESARQYAEEQRRVAELEVVNRVAQAVSQLLRLDSLFRVVHAQMAQVLPQTDLAIGLYEPATDQVAYPLWTEDSEVSERSFAPVGNDMAGYVLRTRQPLTLTEDLAGQAALFGIDLPDRPPLSWMGVPLLAGDTLLGLIAVQDRRQEGRFSDDDAALLATIASQVATAIQNNRLLEETQRTARRERLIHEITSKMRRSPDMRSILDTTAREVGRALNVSRTTVRLGQKPASEPPSLGEPRPTPDGEGQEP